MKINPLRLIISLIIPQLAGLIGSIFTTSSVSAWYPELVKPSINPPSWIFAPVWTLLFILMGIAFYLVWQKGFKSKKAKIARGLFIIQLGLNALWSILFFGLKSPLAAFIEILILLPMIIITTVYFFKVSRPAGYLMIPYIAWVSFATILNLLIVLLN